MSLVALDIGGTKIAARVATAGEGSAATGRTETPPDGEAALAAALELVDSLLAEAAADGVDGVGVSFGGQVDARAGVVRRSLHVPGWDGVPLGSLLEDRLDAPARIANDADAGALGEWHDGGRPPAPVAYVTASTGVGGGIVVDGEILTGADGLAGEVGHLIVDPGGARCGCGRRGCVETVASGPAIARRAGAASAEAVVAAAARGEPGARGVLEQAAHALAVAVSALVAIVDPAFVAIGGGVSLAGPPLWEPLLSELASLAWPDVNTEVRLAASDESPLRGARVLAERAAELRTQTIPTGERGS